MITEEQYFGRWAHHPDATPQRRMNAHSLLDACAKLQELALADGVVFPDNPLTESGISGNIYGGFRPQDCPQGSVHSSHKEGLGVDRYDPKGEIDAWCTQQSHANGALEKCGIYIEAPSATVGWSHWTIRAPGSGHRVFLP